MRFQFQKILTTIIIGGCIVLLAMSPVRNRNNDVFHTEKELSDYLDHSPFVPSLNAVSYFADDSVCGGCHGYDILEFSMVDSNGKDVNTYDDWRTSMMANSTRDPFWRAKVSQEILINPQHSLELQSKCTSCHAPQGNYPAFANGATHYTIEDMLMDPIAMDGVSCGVCHSTSEMNLGNRFSGELTYDTTNVIYGPYTEPFAAPMTDFIGFDPVYSPHISDAGICASCHTLITQSVDLDGEFTGTDFVEQATYHEWLNSAYDDEGVSPTTCQSCHMPRLDDSIVISSQYLFLKGRGPYGLHDLVGGNTMMLQLMKNNKEALGISAQDSHFDETIAKTYAMLQQQSLDMDLEFIDFDADSAYFSLHLTNKTGHKFPSGYPSRRAFIEFVVTTEFDDVLFHSGALGEDYEILAQADSVEQHHLMINDPTQAQIYELVPGDVEGNFTTILERAFQTLKDNRLPPIGFSTTHPAYDTVAIYGAALEDADFNHVNSIEGSGSDLVRYHIPLEGYEGYLHVAARVYYQSLPPKWMAPLFAETTPEIEIFRTMYDEADRSPVMIDEHTIDSIFIEAPSAVNSGRNDLNIQLYPNPTTNGLVYMDNPANLSIDRITVFDLIGRKVLVASRSKGVLDLSEFSGPVVIVIDTNQGAVIRKVLVH